MFISHMLVENYRTFRHVELHFDSRVNYIVGDNNIGKSNFLTLLKFITHGYGFKENDFLEPDKPIRSFDSMCGRWCPAFIIWIMEKSCLWSIRGASFISISPWMKYPEK